MKIVVLDAATLGEDLDLSPLDSEGEVTAYPFTPAELVRDRITGVDAVILNKIRIGEAQLPPIDCGPRLICIAATGYDNIDLAACRAHGVAVANVRGYSTDSVAQVTVGLVLNLVCRLPDYCTSVSDGSYTHSGVANCLTPPYHELAGMTWGIVGAGRIGSRVAEVAKAFGCRVLTCRLHPDERSVDLDTLLREADIVTIHTPLTPATRGMIGSHQLACMKPGAILVNMARGAVTDEAAVAEALRTGKLGGLGTDVYSVEPFGETHPFWAIRHHPCVCLTPHMSWGAVEARERCLAEMILNMKAFFAGVERNRLDISHEGLSAV